MRNSRADVVAAALRVLEVQGLEGCSMRRVAAELEVQPSALYHHVPNKQTLLALMADEIVGGVGEPACAAAGSVSPGTGADAGSSVEGSSGAGSVAAGSPGADPRRICQALRDAMLAVRDGADVVATASAFRLGASAVENRLAALVGIDGARTLLLYTFGQAQATQTHRQAAAFGALLTGSGPAPAAADRTDVDPEPAAAADAEPEPGIDPALDLDASYARGIDLILAGLGATKAATSPRR
ncbi:TetR family transcriptional regulator [Leucobacter rhizosphaerae]|uniref:TetR family transcriptional regulator n=1 Tax=Leucobacter rhizosphaerae TaxID=2932245 RepID=A0ABY4FTY5_9MICO|nr:TetR family transcriptional regulator [Leucobacter rhizosphaerae]UOQ59634.1 TetR family transcriptional regulator [Leucobacter rhizosphaerae]